MWGTRAPVVPCRPLVNRVGKGQEKETGERDRRKGQEEGQRSKGIGGVEEGQRKSKNTIRQLVLFMSSSIGYVYTVINIRTALSPIGIEVSPCNINIGL